MLQPALLWPAPATDAETHLRLTADSGTVMQPLKVGEVVPTIKVHVRPLFPCVIFRLIGNSKVTITSSAEADAWTYMVGALAIFSGCTITVPRIREVSLRCIGACAQRGRISLRS